MEITNIHSSKSTEHGYNNGLGDIIAVKTQKSSKSNGLIFEKLHRLFFVPQVFHFPKSCVEQKLRISVPSAFYSSTFPPFPPKTAANKWKLCLKKQMPSGPNAFSISSQR
jgi:hypothetical protein